MRRRTMYLKKTGVPQSLRDLSRRDLNVCPPGGLVTVAMQLFVMLTAQWDGKLVTDLAPERSRLSKFEVVGIARRALADQAGLSCYKR